MLSSNLQAQQTNVSIKGKGEIVFASDTQAPMWIETLWLKASNNRSATKSIFDNILEREPEAVFLLGDVVNLGASDRQWKPIDLYLKRIRSKGIVVNAALGNHEVMGQARRGQRKFQERFPNHVNTGYVTIIDSIAVILLNSNFGSLTATEEAKQVEWYKSTLQQLDEDSTVSFIITGCHHSPYTNSKIVGSNLAVRQKFVQPFLKSPKSKLFLSGHSHNFEQFKIEGKDFFVIGGGGGLHQPLKTGEGIIPSVNAGYNPMFHYLSVKRNNGGLQLTSLKLNPKHDGCSEGLTINIPGRDSSKDFDNAKAN